MLAFSFPIWGQVSKVSKVFDASIHRQDMTETYNFVCGCSVFMVLPAEQAPITLWTRHKEHWSRTFEDMNANIGFPVHIES